MQLKIEPDGRRHETDGDSLLMPATDKARRRYVLAIRLVDWEALISHVGDAAAATQEVEYLAMSGQWEMRQGRKVWRVRRS